MKKILLGLVIDFMMTGSGFADQCESQPTYGGRQVYNCTDDLGMTYDKDCRWTTDEDGRETEVCTKR